MTQKEPILSIIVPVYNVEPYLQRCVESICSQTLRDFELILVDDGSPDNCPALCDAAAKRDARVRVIHQKNSGLSAARNAGLDVARGEWIGFVDSDDYIAPDMYETLYRAATENDAPLAVCSYAYVDETGKKLQHTSQITKDEVIGRMEAMDRLGIGKNWYYITAWNRLYRRKLFDTVRFPVGKLCEDEFIAHKIYWQCERVAVVAKPLYFYVRRENSIMGQKLLQCYLDAAEGNFQRAEFALEHGLNHLAFHSCNGALGLLVGLRFSGKENANVKRELYRQRMKEMKPLFRRMMKIPRCQKLKWKLVVFLISPRLYYALLQLKQRFRKNK